MSKSHEIIQMLSVLTSLFPIIVCFLVFNKGSLEIRLFLFFLVIGFLTDVIMLGLVKLKIEGYLEPMSTVYSLVEATFFYWLIMRHLELKFRPIVKIIYILTFIYWIFLTIIRINIGPGAFSVGQYFDPIYEIPVSFFAGFILLKMVEKDDSVFDKPMFWIFIGIFFYCFCTFFIATFLNSFLSLRIWFLHNIFNIVMLAFYTIGLWRYYKMHNSNTVI